METALKVRGKEPSSYAELFLSPLAPPSTLPPPPSTPHPSPPPEKEMSNTHPGSPPNTFPTM